MASEADRKAQVTDEARQARASGVLDGGLSGLLRQEGLELQRVAIKLGEFDTLLILNAQSAEGPVVCFVGAGGPSNALLKAYKLARGGKLRWKVDRWNQEAT